MSTNESSPATGRVPPAGVSRFDALFGSRIKGTLKLAPQPRPAHRVVHEPESSLPANVAGLRPETTPLRAAAGDDDLMSTQPAKVPAARTPVL